MAVRTVIYDCNVNWLLTRLGTKLRLLLESGHHTRTPHIENVAHTITQIATLQIGGVIEILTRF